MYYSDMDDDIVLSSDMENTRVQIKIKIKWRTICTLQIKEEERVYYSDIKQ